ncbi:magnesium transporter [Roridomyces roridus]|uniref:Magnesium transporter n=1 Tax=Roridomyces roridus TaxID=1738132 RepID=A0AAD7C1S4_9AGAR|nr:magnesium transporter [Roridomyces roridus]
MARENSFSDSDGRSLTPDLEQAYPPPPIPDPTSHHHVNLQKIRTKESARSRATPGVRSPVSALQPRDRFRRAVRKVIALHRGTNIMATARHGRAAGAEPGIDPRRATADLEFGWIQEECVVEVVDYSSVGCNVQRMKNNEEFIRFMNDPSTSARQPWVKVRWINIGGLSWDVVKAVSLRYDLHPLALEDVFHSNSRVRSKADYYAQHLFLRILCHELQGKNSDADLTETISSADLSSSDSPSDASDLPVLQNKDHNVSQFFKMHAAAVKADAQRRAQDAALRVLKRHERVNVNVVPMFIFLLRDGTVISIHSTPNLETTAPIAHRLRQFDTALRTSADAPMLVQSLLSLITDKALEVVDAYKTKIQHLEKKIMTKPDIDTVLHLHVLCADLILHRRTLGPIKTVIYGLRRYDADRAEAIAEMDAVGGGEDGTGVKGKAKGWMSHKANIYLADVSNNMDYVLNQVDVIAGIGQNLVDYTFNMTSYELNEVMRRLMLVTVIFLPLTFLTGYFGMNFAFMWTTLHPTHSDVIFWAIALPIMAIVIPLFLAQDILRLVQNVRKRMEADRIIKTFKAA